MKLLIASLLCIFSSVVAMENSPKAVQDELKFDQYNVFKNFPYDLKKEIALAEWGHVLDHLKAKREKIVKKSLALEASDLQDVDANGSDAIANYIMLKKILLVEKEAPKGMINYLLWEASKNGLYMSALIMIELGADINYESKRTALLWTPLHVAVFNGNADIVELLMLYGVDTTIKGYVCSLYPSRLDHTNGMTACQISQLMFRGMCRASKQLKNSAAYHEKFTAYKKIFELLNVPKGIQK